MIFYTVIDTNVLVSALLSKKEDAATTVILKKIFAGEIIPVFSEEILKEYREVLNRKKFKFPEILINTLLNSIASNGLLLQPGHCTEQLPDPKDIPFYEVVMEKQDEGTYLVTGNQKHFPQKPFIVTPREFLNILAEKEYHS